MVEFGFKRAASEQFAVASAWMREDSRRRVLFSDAKALPECVDLRHVTSLGSSNRRDWVLLRAGAISDCH